MPGAVEFLKGVYGAYYARYPTFSVRFPEQREWMVEQPTAHPDKTDHERYLNFPTLGNVAWYAAQHVPWGIHYSTTRYLKVATSDDLKDESNRISVDLIADVDCNPGPPPKGYGTFNQAMAAAKKQILRALDILEHELDVSTKEFDLTYGGSKGYHIRASEGELHDLSREGRRELAVLLEASPVDVEILFPKVAGRRLDRPPSTNLSRRLYPVVKSICTLARKEARPPALVDAAARIPDLPWSAEDGLQMLADAKDPEKVFAHREDNPRKGLANKELADFALGIAARMTSPTVDRQVMYKGRGMIRAPGSINPKSGLVCTLIKDRAALERFEPLVDANPHDRNRTVQVRGNATRALQVGDETFRVQANQVTDLPLHVAVVFVASHSATPV